MKEIVSQWIELIKKYDYNKKKLNTILLNFSDSSLCKELMNYADALSQKKDELIDKKFDKQYKLL